MRLLCVLFATLLGAVMVLRSIVRLWKRGRDGVNINEAPTARESESILVDVGMLVLGGVLLLPLFAFLLS